MWHAEVVTSSQVLWFACGNSGRCLCVLLLTRTCLWLCVWEQVCFTRSSCQIV